MPHFTMSRRKFAGVPVIATTATTPLPAAPHGSRRAVALGRLPRYVGQVAIPGQLAGAAAPRAGR